MNSSNDADRPRRRHRDGADDDERRRYFTEVDPAVRSNTRHRRRRLDGDTSVPIWQTGPVPRVSERVDPGTGRVLPQRIEPGQRVEAGQREAGQRAEAPAVRPSVTPRRAEEEPNIRRHAPAASDAAPAARTEPSSTNDAGGELVDEATVQTVAPPVVREPESEPEQTVDTIRRDDAGRVILTPIGSADDDRSATPTAGRQAYSEVVEEPEYPIGDDDVPDAPRSRATARGGRHRNVVLAVVVVCLIAMVGGLGYVGLRFLGVIGNSDYSGATGTGDVLVTIPDDSTLRDFGQILTDKDVVGSVKAFTNAADGKMLSAGIYKLRTEISASAAVTMLEDTSMAYRVGRVVIPEGVQLDSKTGIDGKVTPGVFQLIADATSTTINGRSVGVSVDALSKAAADATIEELGIPQWAKTEVTALNGDHRRVEGLIAPGTWESIDPASSATAILHKLIGDSTRRYEQWGLLGTNDSKLSPYQTLVAASVVEREVSQPGDYSKVARVIVNRLADDQRLEMDSTANYTAAITNIDVHGDAYKADNQWNTYRVKGLPPTPIATVGQKALEAVLHPPAGNWKYFITVDKEGTTLFAATFEEHKKNRQQACANKFLTVGCG